MAATKTSRNSTPNTPNVSESKIARMKVDELRRELSKRGVKGTATLKKADLVKKLIKAETSGGKKKASAGRNKTPNTPNVSESKIARMKVGELRKKLANRGVKGTADLKKADLVKKMIKLETSGAKSRSASAKSASAKSKSASAKSGSSKSAATKSGSAKSGSAKSGGKRTGKKTSDSLKYAQEITSTADRPERAGRSLVTTDHEVIQRWAKARGAVPSTVAGTHHNGHLGVLRFDFPGYSGDRLMEVSWAEWLRAFDQRRLNFIYQETRSGGGRSNFFQLENPDE
jgi:predicted HTH domain antitoxin